MGKDRTVKADKVHIEILDGEEWIDIKSILNVGDQKKLESAGLKAAIVDGKLFNIVDWTVHDQERVLIFLLDWSLKGPGDKDLEINRNSLDNLDPEVFTAINSAINAQVLENARKKAEARAARNTPTNNENGGKQESGPSSTSPNTLVVAG